MDNVGSDAEQMADLCRCPMRLVTMAGKEIETTVPLSIYHHWEMLEDYLVELLAKCHDLDTFGCELTLISEDARSPLNDPIHEELWEHHRYQLIIQKRFRVVSSKEQIKRETYEDHPKAIWVPTNETGVLPAKAFFALARLRHVQVEAGYHTIERQAWRYCHTLIIVRLPGSVVTVENAVFQGCYALTTVAMPGCLHLGARVFAECCALEQVGILTARSCHLARGATISPYAFEGCARLKQIGLPLTKAITGSQDITSPPEGLPTGCFHSAGIQNINFPQCTVFIGHKAFAHCQQLTTVDLSLTHVRTVQVQVFSHCRALAQVSLPKYLAEICAEAFEACAVLSTVALPQPCRSIGHRAFAECNSLVGLTYRSAQAGQHDIHVAANAFEGCLALAVPSGICVLSRWGIDKGL